MPAEIGSVSTVSDAVPAPPAIRQAWTVRTVACDVYPEATSWLPRWAEPAISRPVTASNTARSQSPPEPSSRAVTEPSDGAATVCRT